MKLPKNKKTALAVALLLAILAGAMFGWNVWENRNGADTWRETLALLEANDVELDISTFASEPVPADENFCATPLVASLAEFEFAAPYVDGKPVYGRPRQNAELSDLLFEMTSFEVPRVSRTNGTKPDLDAVLRELQESAKNNPPRSILEWTKNFAGELKELDAVADLPSAEFIFLPSGDPYEDSFKSFLYLSDLRYIEQLEVLRACAALDAGDTVQAEKALHGIFQIQRACSADPTLFGFMEGLRSLDQCLSISWLGMATKRWTAQDLKWIGDRLDSIDPTADLERAINFDLLALQMGAPDFMKNSSYSDSRDLLLNLNLVYRFQDAPKILINAFAIALPDGIWDLNKAHACRVTLEQVILPLREHRFVDDAALAGIREQSSIRTFFAQHLGHRNGFLVRQCYYTQVGIDLARVACSLERYFLDTGDYPESLDALVPNYLDEIPIDFVNPPSLLRYSKGLHDDRYRIYSLGQNQIDDQGRPAWKERPPSRSKSKKPPRLDLSKGDWVWGYSFEKPQAKTE